MNNGILSPVTILAGLMATAYGLDSLTVGDFTYENVQLKNEYPTSLFIQHSGGTAFIEKAKLNQEQIASIVRPTADAEQTDGSSDAKSRTSNEQPPANIMPKLETLTNDEERAFFAACQKADAAQIKQMLAANPDLVKAAMRGQLVESFPAPEAGESRYEIIPITVTALQTLIDESPKAPERIEAIKALVEAGADVKTASSKMGYAGACNPVSRPRALTPEELDYLLSQGADPYFGWCSPRLQPLTDLAFNFVTTKDPQEKSAAAELLRVFIKHKTDPGAPTEFFGFSAEQLGGQPAAEGQLRTAQEISDAAQDKELAAILAGN